MMQDKLDPAGIKTACPSIPQLCIRNVGTGLVQEGGPHKFNLQGTIPSAIVRDAPETG